MNNNLSSKKQRTNKRSRPRRRNNQSTTDLSPLSRGRPVQIRLERFLVQPDRLTLRLRYLVHYQVNNAGQPIASKSYYINGVYDVDPSVGSTSVPGFAEWMTLYGTYRVESAEIDLRLASQEAFPVAVVDGFFPNATYSAVNSVNVNILANRLSESHVLSTVGGMDRCLIKRQINMAALFGDRTSYYGDVQQFLGTSATNPVSLFTWFVAVEPINPTDTLVNGVSMWGYIDFVMEVFNPLVLRM